MDKRGKLAKVLKAKEAANTLRISLSTLYKLIKQRELNDRKVGKGWRFQRIVWKKS